MQRRRDAQTQAATAAPIFNFTIGREVIDILRHNGGDQDMNAGAPAPPYQHAPPVAIPVPPAAVPIPPVAIPPVANSRYDVQYPNILQADRRPGPDMTITEFCAHYDLGDGTRQKFITHGYERARVLRFITLDDVTKMELRLGEIAELRDAIERWSVPR